MNSGPSTLPASGPTFAQNDIVQVVTPDGRVGVWIDENAFGDMLAGITWEKGEERKKTQEQRTRAEIAENNVRQLVQSQQPGMQFLTWGLPSALVAAAIAAICAFFGGQAAAKGLTNGIR